MAVSHALRSVRGGFAVWPQNYGRMECTWHHREACVKTKLSHEEATTVRWTEREMDQNTPVIGRRLLEERGILGIRKLKG